MRCCAECFGDRGLRRNIFPLRSNESGDCGYCGQSNVPILSPRTLSEYFELLISAYRPDTEGKLLVEWLRADWGLFSHPRMDDAHAKDLLAEILDDGEIVRQRFSPSIKPAGDSLGEWENLRDELMHRNRFFPDSGIDWDRLKFLLNHLALKADEVPDVWYRARIRSGFASFSIEEMGAPPKGTASHGRANPAGIPYLYVGSTPETSIAEVRPHTGQVACVAKYRTDSDLKLVDLRDARRMVSPFLLEDAENICKMRGDLPFLERLGDELTRPVVPQSAVVDYTPSQYLCEFIKKCGFDGVVYRSSVGEGINLALFHPEKAQAATTRVIEYDIGRVLVDVRQRE